MDLIVPILRNRDNDRHSIAAAVGGGDTVKLHACGW
jgi:hypothetical protein